MNDDTISRKAVMESLTKEYNRRFQEGGLKLAWIEKAVNETPAAQPPLEEFEWCTGCKEYDSEKHCCPRFNYVIRTTIDDVRKEAYKHGKSKGIKKGRAMAQRWIPVSERLPEIKDHHVSDPCIVYCDNGAYGFAELEENIFGQVGWNCERDDEYHEPLGEVIAWMPLPEPFNG